MPEQETPVVENEQAITAPQENEQPDITDILREESALDSMLVTKPRKPKKEKSEPAQKPVEAAAPAEPAAEPESTTEPAEPVAEPSKPVRVRKPRQPEMTPAQIAQLAAEAASNVTRQQQSQPKPQEASVEDELPDSWKPMADVYKELERVNPKYKGITKKKAEFLRREADYVERWENAQRTSGNPASYDPDSAEHAAFYEKYDVKIDPNDLEDAKFEVRYRNRKSSDIDPELQSVKKTLAAIKAEPEANAAVNQFGNAVIKNLNPEFKGTKEDFEAWRSEHVIEDEIANEAHRELAPVVKAASMLWDGVEDFDKSNPAHAQASNLFAQMEQELASNAEPITNERDQTWIPAAQYERLSAGQKSRHFTTTKQNLVNYIAITASNYVKKVASERKQFAEEYAKKLGYAKVNASQTTQKAPTQTPSRVVQTPASPSVSSGGATPPTSGVVKPDGKGQVDGVSALLGLA